MSFDPNGAGKRDASTRSFINDTSIMGERSHLPDLDYKKLAMDRLGFIKKTADKAPTGRYDPLVAYLKQRGSNVGAAEVDRRIRTFFEDVINKVIAQPGEWDQDRVLDGKALMDFLSGVKAPAAPAAQQQPPAPQQPGAQG